VRRGARLFGVVAVAVAATGVSACPPRGDAAGGAEIKVGSKGFTESVILGEIAAVVARGAGARVRQERELGGTRVLYAALARGDVDAYPEYTGTLAREIFSGRALRGDDDLRSALARDGVSLGPALGFDNGYVLGMREEVAARLGIRTISDLRAHPELVLGFSNEFMERGDGWPALRQAYDLPQRDARGVDHDLAYRGLEQGSIDVIDLYATDAEIRYYKLRTLADDRAYFPAYRAVLLWRTDLPGRAPAAVAALRGLEGRIDAAAMTAMNARAKLDRVPEATVARDWAAGALGLRAAAEEDGRAARIWRRTREHLVLVGVSLLFALLVALPLGVAAARRPRLGQLVLGVVGVVQTIPSLALLVFMIPVLGIGSPPAFVALFLYGLLPIVRNTATGLRGIAPELVDSARALGLPPGAVLRLVELPLASPAILAGVKTSAVINVGTATLGALIGAGGYGQPIVTGIRLDNVGLILEGAIPAAVLALAVQGVFDLCERFLVPRGLRAERLG
jgi:osmoprotectant transport system permease protein